MESRQAARHRELGNFLRSRRERIKPDQYGIPTGKRRRTPGLRRGEVALLAGLSLEWYTYLEQGRPIHVSHEVLESLARVFLLDDNERRHLFTLADRRQQKNHLYLETALSPELLHFLHGLNLIPAYVTDKRMNLIAWNRAFEAVYQELLEDESHSRNLMWITFTSNSFRMLKGEHWEEEARHGIAQFRSGYGQYLEDPWWPEQVKKLKTASSEFQVMWEEQEILFAPLGRKTLNHPIAGKMIFNYIAFQSMENPELQVIINNPVEGSETENGVKLLLEQRAVSTNF